MDLPFIAATLTRRGLLAPGGPIRVVSQLNALRLWGWSLAGELRQAAARNSHLSADDVETRTLRVPGLAVSYITSTSQLADRHLRQDAPAGTALTVDLLAADILVKRGQRVTLVASTGTLEVRAQGEAVADATPAGRVRVLNLNSRRIVEGQVESRDRVRVAL